MKIHTRGLVLAGTVLLLAGVLLASRAGTAEPPREAFDHATTGFLLTGAHARVTCEGCHVRGLFKGTPRPCASCHTQSGLVKATAKPVSHISSTMNCDACHTTRAWNMVPHVDHSAVLGSCSNCHNGRVATGKAANHIPSPNTCETCHTTNRWTGARFDHNGVTGTCFSCHNGATARGKSANHIASPNTCETCHTTTMWTGARFNHSGVTGTCSSCHNGASARGKSANHFVTTVQCDGCHTTTAWVPVLRYRHSSPNYPGDHATGVLCVSCHTGNSQVVPWRSGAYAPACAGCHAGTFKPDKHKKVASPIILYTVSELRNCAGACHQYTDPSLTTIAKTRNAQHLPSRVSW